MTPREKRPPEDHDETPREGEREQPVQPFTVSRLSDVVPVSVLQTLQTGFATEHDIPLAIVEPDGDGFRYITPFEEDFNRTRFCRILRGTGEGERRCREGDFAITREMIEQGPAAKPRWHRCHMGLADVAIPMIVAGKVVAVFFTGQKRLPGSGEQVRERVGRAAEEIEGLDGDALCEAAGELDERTEEEMRELTAALEEHATEIAKLGRHRYDLERELRQELLLDELMFDLARPCESHTELRERLSSVLARVNDFFRLCYSTIYVQSFPRSHELASVACVGECGGGERLRLHTRSRPRTEPGDPTYRIIATREGIRAFLEDNGPAAEAFLDAQALIWDFGDIEERMTLTVFGPQREGHTETLVSTGGDDFLERFHFEIGMRAKVARLLLDLEKANEDKTQFLAQTTHEINAGLQTIVEEGEWLQYYATELAGLDDPEVLEPLEKILSEVLRLGARARSSLFHLRGGMPRSEYNLTKSHPIHALIASCVEPFRTVAQSRNIGVKIEESVRRLPRAPFDWEMMRTVFLNLVDNAVKYSHFNRTIRIHGRAAGDRLSVSIEDFGLGIPTDEFEMIFRPYIRGTQRDPRRFIWGSGLGLSVARDIVETHNGTIEVKSVPMAKEPVTDPSRAWENHLTTFTVTLPLRQED